MTRRKLTAIALWSMLAFVVACGGGDDIVGTRSTGPGGDASASGRTTSGGVPDACTVVTAAEIRAALGTDPGTATKQQIVASRSTCTYSKGIIVGVSEASQFDASIKAGQGAGARYEDVSGVGERAKFAVIANTVAQMWAVEGRLMIDINAPLVNSDREKSRAALVKLVAGAFAKLG